MPEQKHTPGPRIVKQFDDAQLVVLGPDKGNGKRDTVATFTGPRRAADARLDAAAPNLLRACKKVEAALRGANRQIASGICVWHRLTPTDLALLLIVLENAIAETEDKT